MIKIRKLAIISFFVLAAMSSAIAVCAQAPSKSDESTLRHLKEVEWPKAYRDQDQTLLNRILADEFQKIGADGTWTTKKQELEYIKANKPDYDTFRFEIKRLEIFENGTAIVAGTGHITGKDKEGEYKVLYQSSNILIKRGGVWKAISSHVSGVKTERPGKPAGN